MANRLVLELLADSNGLLKGLDQAQRSVDRFTQSSSIAGRSLGGGVNQALEAFTGLAKGGAAAAGVLAGAVVAVGSAAVALTLRAGRQAEELDHLSQKTGIAVQSIQRMSVVMAENNFDAQTLTSGMRTLSKMVVDARNPASAAAATFEEMGLSIHQLGSTEDVIRAVADRFAAMPDGVDKSRLAITLFGKAGLDMIPVLNRGAAAFDASAKASERFGVVLSTQQLAALQAADDASDRFSVALNGLQLQLSATFAPAVTVAIDAVTEKIASMTTSIKESTSALSTFFDEFKRNHPTISSMLLGEVAGHAAPRLAPIVSGPEQSAHVADFATASAEKQIAMGERAKRAHLTALEAANHRAKAEEALGKITFEIAQRQNQDRNEAFGLMVEEEERIRTLNLELSKPPTTGPFIEALEKKEAAIANLLSLMPELSRQEAIVLAAENQASAEQTINASSRAWQHRNDELEMAVERSKTVDAAQQALFRSESGMLGASETARRVRLQLIEDEGALQRQTIEETIFNETQKNAAITNLDLQLQTRRRQAIQEFPTVWQQQLQTLVASNTFSVGMIVSGWTSGLANAIVNFENFGQAMTQIGKQTAATLLQGILQFGIESAAKWALQASTTEAIKTAEAAAVVGINTGKNAAVVAGDTAAAGTTVSIWAAASASITGMFAAVFAAVSAFIMGTIIPTLVSVGTAVITFLSGIASALDVSIFGAPFSIPVWAAVALVGAAIGSIAAFAFADGGIATGPTTALIGEAGSSEAVIPLNQRGAAFMRETLGLGGSGGQPVIQNRIYLDGREIALAMSDRQPSALRLMGALS